MNNVSSNSDIPRSIHETVSTVAAGTGSPPVSASSPDDPAAATPPNDTFDDYGRMMRDGFAFKYES